MLRSLRSFKGYTLGATDGEIGEVHDLCFDDTEWVVRYLVADTGTWLPGRLVLISPSALGHPDWATRILPVNLTKEQVQQSPSIDADRPVSRQREAEVVKYFGWPAYWTSPLVAAGLTAPLAFDPGFRLWGPESEESESEHHPDDPHLCSARTVMGYHVQANDGQIGHVEDFVVDDEDWAIRYLVIDTKNWWPSRKVLMLPIYVVGISWDDSLIRVNAPRETVASGPTYDPSAPVNQEYELLLYDYYGRPSRA